MSCLCKEVAVLSGGIRTGAIPRMHFALRRVGMSRRSLAGRSTGREEHQGKRHPRYAGSRVNVFERAIGFEADHHGDVTLSEEDVAARGYAAVLIRHRSLALRKNTPIHRRLSISVVAGVTLKY